MYKAIHYLDKPFEKMSIINFFETIILQRNFFFIIIIILQLLCKIQV